MNNTNLIKQNFAFVNIHNTSSDPIILNDTNT